MDQRPFSLADIYEVVADACRDRRAVVAVEARLTYRQLGERANRLGHHLQAAGKADDRWAKAHAGAEPSQGRIV